MADKQDFELRIRFQMTSSQVARDLATAVSANLVLLAADATAELWALLPPSGAQDRAWREMVRLGEEIQGEPGAD